MAPPTLPISQLIQISLNISPQAAQGQSLSQLLVLTSDTVIDVVSRLRSYSSLTQVATDFGTNSPAFFSASLWFAQQPQPTSLLIGRWAKTNTHAQLLGGGLTSANSLIGAWTPITNGSFHIIVDGTAHDVTGLNFSAQTNLNGVATTIQTALAAIVVGSTVVYNSVFNRFEFTDPSSGTASTLSFLSAVGSGTDISAQLAGTLATGAFIANGILAESAVAAATLFDNLFGQQWYALDIPEASTSDHQAVASFIEGTTTYHSYGVTTQDPNTLIASDQTDLAFLLQQAKFNRTTIQYSSTSAYAIASLLGRILTTNYQANNSAITLMFKQEPSVTAENLNQTQLASLLAKNCNVFTAYNNNTAIIQPGVMTSGVFADTEIGSAALVIGIQTAVYNLLFLSPTKIPQTDAGMHLISTTIEGVLSQFVSNGLLASGVWNSAGFGTISQGDTLSKGFYVFTPPVSQQPQASRAARLSVSFQIAAKLAGAVHDVVISVNVNS